MKKTGAILAALLPCLAHAAIIRVVPQVANDLVYSPTTNNIYFSVPSSGGVYANQIGRLSTASATVTGGMVAGSEPNKLAISDNGIDLYSGFTGAGTFRRFNAQTMTSGSAYSLGSDGSLGTLYVEDIEVMPNAPGTVAISLRNQGFSPRHMGVGIYDNGVVRANKTATHTGSNVIEFSTNPARLYGYNNETTEFGYRKMDVDATGVKVKTVFSNVIQGFGVDFAFADGRIFATNGQTVDAESGTLVGTMSGSGPIAVDAANRRAFFLTGSGAATLIKVFDIDTYVPVDTISVPQAIGTGGSLIRYGANGLAFRTASQILLVEHPAVPEPASLLAFSGLVVAGAVAKRKARSR